MKLKKEEMLEIDGGSPVSDAVAVLTFWGGCIAVGFNAGRQFVRDIRNWLSNKDTDSEPIIVVPEPI